MGLLSGQGAGAYKSVDRTNFTATAGQTTFTLSQGYAVGDTEVFLNGIKLVEGDDYYGINGIDIVLSLAAGVGDILQVVSYNQFSAANTYTKTESDSRYMVSSGINPMTSYLRAPNYGVSSWSDSANASLEASNGAGEQGVGVKAFGRSVATNGGDVLYTSDSRGAGGRHRFGYWNGTSFIPSMVIDKVGRITTPNQPAFFSYGLPANLYANYGSGAITFANTPLNRGGHWNNTTFTAPITGVYHMFFDAMYAHRGGDFALQIFKNASTVAYNNAYGIDSAGNYETWTSSTVSWLGELVTGDSITFRYGASNNASTYLYPSGFYTRCYGNLVG